MTEDELNAIDQRLAAMSERVEAVIEREKPLGKRMPILNFKPRSMPVIASNSQQSRHRGNYQPFDREISDEALRSAVMKFDHAMEQAPDGSIEQIFAEFERQFDEMAQAHRYR